MVDLMCCLTNLLFFDTPLFYCYTNLNSSIICCFFFWWFVSFFGASISLLASSFFKCNSIECNSVGDFFKTLVILSAILLPIKSPVASTVFRIALFEAVFIAFVLDFLALTRHFWPYLCFSQMTKIHIFLHILYL